MLKKEEVSKCKLPHNKLVLNLKDKLRAQIQNSPKVRRLSKRITKVGDSINVLNNTDGSLALKLMMGNINITDQKEQLQTQNDIENDFTKSMQNAGV